MTDTIYRDSRGRLMEGHPGLNFKSGPDHPMWRGGAKHSHGYVYLRTENHPTADIHSYVKRGRLVIEKHLGRYLLSSELVHHKNGIKDDDRLVNLELTTRAEHARQHSTKQGWAMKFDRCVVCGTTEVKHHAKGRCKNCYERIRTT